MKSSKGEEVRQKEGKKVIDGLMSHAMECNVSPPMRSIHHHSHTCPVPSHNTMEKVGKAVERAKEGQAK